MDEKKAKKRVTFKLHAPDASNVCLAGDFNEWDKDSISLKPDRKDADGVWQRMVYLEPGEYRYRFIVDGVWCDDPQCTDRSMNEYGSYNSVLRVQDEGSTGPRKKSQAKKGKI